MLQLKYFINRFNQPRGAGDGECERRWRKNRGNSSS